MILCGIFLTQGSSVMLWRHLKQSPTLDLFKNCYKSLLLILWNHIIPPSFRTHQIIIIKIKINPTHVPKSIPCRIFLSESLFIGYPYSFNSSFFILSLSFWKISKISYPFRVHTILLFWFFVIETDWPFHTLIPSTFFGTINYIIPHSNPLLSPSEISFTDRT